MVSQMQRAFAQKLTSNNVVSSPKSSEDSTPFNPNTISTNNDPNISDAVDNIVHTIVEPLDYEQFYHQQHSCSGNNSVDNDDPLMEFPDGSDDVDVYVLPRKVRTLVSAGPEEDISKLAPHVRDFVRAYSRDWLVVDYIYRQTNTVEDDRLSLLAYEDTWIPSSRSSTHSRTSTSSTLQRTHAHQRQLFKNDHHNYVQQPKDIIKPISKNSSCTSSENTLVSNNNSSGISSSTDLINTANDPLIGTVLQRLPIDTLDRLNGVARQENRQNQLFGPCLPVTKIRQKCNYYIEYSIKQPVPREIVASRRILVKCLQLEYSLDIDTEPMYAHMSLYDVRRRKKMSENFYFDFNSCTTAGNEVDTTTRSRTCVLDIDGTGSTTGDDLFLVIRLEKPLRGESDSVNSTSDILISSINNDKIDVKSSNKSVQPHQVKYRMPYAWTAVHLADVICCSGGTDSLDRNSTGSGSNSLDGRFGLSEFDRFRKKWATTGDTTVRRGSLDRRTSYSTAATNAVDNRYSWSSDEFTTDTFRPVTLTVNGFFKQETDKLKDDDLYKLLQELKRPLSCPSKKLKNVNGSLKLDISPCPIDDVKQCLTADLMPLLSYDVSSEDKIRPIKEVLEFPLASCRVSSPHYVYRNLLYVYPKELNFAGRTGSARNIAVKIQLMCGERQPHDAAYAIFGKSSSPRYVCEAYTAVSYHQRCPSFYDEIKIRLPADLDDRHHLLFTFYHVSCRRRGTLVGNQDLQHKSQVAPETPIGYTWLPLLKDRCLRSGEICLPVALELPPPANYSYITPDVPLPGIEWVENHKGLFTVLLEPVSSIHPRDIHLNNFFNYCSVLEHNPLPRRVAESNIEAELKHRISNLVRCQLDPLIEFVPVVLDKLLSLLVESPVTQYQQPMNLGQTIFRTLADLVSMTMSHSQGQQILSSYVRYQCCCCNVAAAAAANIKNNTSENENDDIFSNGQEYSERLDKYFRLRSNSDPDVTKKPCSSPLLDGNTFAAFKSNGLDRACSMKTGRCQGNIPSSQFEEHHQIFCSDQKRSITMKSVHEELALQWVVATSMVRREAAANHSRFLFDVIIKSMAVSLAMVPGGLDSDRKNRFSDQFFDDISTLCTSIALDIVSNYEKDSKQVNIINCNLAWFLHDLLSLADRGFVFGLINTYIKTLFSKQQSLLIQLPHHENYCSLSSLKLDFLKIICSHEHYVPLNLITNNFDSVSPTFSVASTISNKSLSMASCTTLSNTEATVKEYAELSIGFRHQHYLVGLVLSEFVTVLQCSKSDFKVKEKVVDLLLGLMSSHDTLYQQDRWSSRHKATARVALMYLPLLTAVTMDSSFLNLLQLDFENDNDTIKNKLINNDNENNFDSYTPDGYKTPEKNIEDNVNAISASSLMGVKNTTASWYTQTNKNNYRKSKLNSVTSTKVLACILWILKNLDNNIMHVWLADSSVERAQNTLSILTLCINRFFNNSNNYKKGNYKCVNCISQTPFSSTINSSQSASSETCNNNDNTNNMSKTASSSSLSSTSQLTTTDDVKSRLEDVILGQGSARSELMRRKAGLDSGVTGSTSKVRWRKDHVLTYNKQSSLQACSCNVDGQQQLDKIFGSNPDQSDVELDLVNEIGFIVLDTIEQIIQVASSPSGLKNSSPIHWSIHRVFKLLLRAMSTIIGTTNNQQYSSSTTSSMTAALQCMFGTQRSMVAKFPELLFGDGRDEIDLDFDTDDDDKTIENYHLSTSCPSSNRCANLILMLLRHCAINSSTVGVRAQAAASLYSLMRQNFDIENNFARIKMQITVALSTLIGVGATSTTVCENRKVTGFNEQYLRRVLKTILLYAERDSVELQNTTFPDQVKDLILNLHTILSDTVQMKEYSQDPDMLMDLMYRVAKGYQQTSSPDLRLAWLQNMARKHSQRNNFTEAAMCLVHGAALVVEYLTTTENLDLVGCRGATCLECVSPNVLEECAVSDDVMVVSQAADQLCLGEEFTEIGLVSLLDRAAELFQKAGMFEAMSQVYNKVAIPLIEKTNDYKKLSDIYLKLHDSYGKLERLQGRRVFGTYFRVGFYGAKFFGADGLDGEEFVYKEPTLTKLSEIFGRLQNFYSERFGEDCVTIIKDSNTVDVTSLDPRKAYIQITYVEPYFDTYEERTRATHFQRNFNLKRFVFFTPFTPDGRAHGQLNQQYKRKTILTVAHHFPYLKTRIRVQNRQTVVMGPIEVALEDLRKKTDELARSVRQHPADPKMLQMVLQGCIGTTVNLGPMEMATVFLTPRYDKSNGDKSLDGVDESTMQLPPPRLQNKLRLCFKDFSKKCADALAKNKTLIGPDQRDYQRELERNYRRFTDQLAPLLKAATTMSPFGGYNNSLGTSGPPYSHHSNGGCSLTNYDDKDEEDDTTIMNNISTSNGGGNDTNVMFTT